MGRNKAKKKQQNTKETKKNTLCCKAFLFRSLISLFFSASGFFMIATRTKSLRDILLLPEFSLVANFFFALETSIDTFQVLSLRADFGNSMSPLLLEIFSDRESFGDKSSVSGVSGVCRRRESQAVTGNGTLFRRRSSHGCGIGNDFRWSASCTLLSALVRRLSDVVVCVECFLYPKFGPEIGGSLEYLSLKGTDCATFDTVADDSRVILLLLLRGLFCPFDDIMAVFLSLTVQT